MGSELALAVPAGDAGRLLVAVATLSVLVGLALIAAALLRFGFVASFISEPVLDGFKAGIGAVIVADQLPKLLELHIQKAGFLRDLFGIGSCPQRHLDGHNDGVGGNDGGPARARPLDAAAPGGAGRRRGGHRRQRPARLAVPRREAASDRSPPASLRWS